MLLIIVIAGYSKQLILYNKSMPPARAALPACGKITATVTQKKRQILL
jgi:hypothetical protein